MVRWILDRWAAIFVIFWSAYAIYAISVSGVQWGCFNG